MYSVRMVCRAAENGRAAACALSVDVLLFLVGERHEDDRQETGRNQQNEGPVPAGLLRNRSDDDVGQDGRAEEVAEESGQSGSRFGLSVSRPRCGRSSGSVHHDCIHNKGVVINDKNKI